GAADRESSELSPETGSSGRFDRNIENRHRLGSEMIEIVRYNAGESNAALDRIRSRGLDANTELIANVTAIIERVRSGGDQALVAYTKQFDGVELQQENIRVDPEFIRNAASKAESNVVAAFRLAIKNVRVFHERERESDWTMTNEDG